jgi:hypothetical protein
MLPSAGPMTVALPDKGFRACAGPKGQGALLCDYSGLTVLGAVRNDAQSGYTKGCQGIAKAQAFVFFLGAGTRPPDFLLEGTPSKKVHALQPLPHYRLTPAKG